MAALQKRPARSGRRESLISKPDETSGFLMGGNGTNGKE